MVDLPGDVSAVAASLIVNATGTVSARTAVLTTPEEIDQATNSPS